MLLAGQASSKDLLAALVEDHGLSWSHGPLDDRHLNVALVLVESGRVQEGRVFLEGRDLASTPKETRDRLERRLRAIREIIQEKLEQDVDGNTTQGVEAGGPR